MTTLRDYQVRAINLVREQCQQGNRRPVCVMPTGAGKTRTFAEVSRRVVDNGGQVLWLAHRAELVDQAVKELSSFGLNVGAISASAQTPPNPFASVQVATVQTLLSRNIRPRAQLVIADEAHHYVADQWITLLQDYPDAIVIGLTATPERSDGRGLGEMFNALVVGATVRELTDLGHLVPCEILRPDRSLEPGQIAQSPVDAYTKHAAERRTIVFARSVELAEGYTNEFRMHGIEARCISADTPWPERSLYIDAFRAGTISVLVNVYVLTEGFDAPETSCIILARGCGTPGTYLQMIGRALRPAPNKSDALLIDLRGVSHELGTPADDRIYSLDGKGIRLSDENVYCPVCGASRKAGEGCPSCGWQPGGDGIAPDQVTNDPLVKYAKKRAEGDEQRTKTLLRWMRIAREKGYKPGWIFMKWQAVYGTRLKSADYYAAERSLQSEAAS